MGLNNQLNQLFSLPLWQGIWSIPKLKKKQNWTETKFVLLVINVLLLAYLPGTLQQYINCKVCCIVFNH